MIRNFILLFLFTSNYLFSSSDNYYLYVASESDDVVSLLRIDGKEINDDLYFSSESQRRRSPKR